MVEKIREKDVGYLPRKRFFLLPYQRGMEQVFPIFPGQPDYKNVVVLFRRLQQLHMLKDIDPFDFLWEHIKARTDFAGLEESFMPFFERCLTDMLEERAKVSLARHLRESGEVLSEERKTIVLQDLVRRYSQPPLRKVILRHLLKFFFSWGVVNGYLKIAKWAHGMGANINEKDDDGSAPIHTAIAVNDIVGVKFIIKLPGFDFGIRDENGKALLELLHEKWLDGPSDEIRFRWNDIISFIEKRQEEMRHEVERSVGEGQE